MAKKEPLYPHVPKSRENKELSLMQWLIDDTASTLHDLGQRLFFQVEAKMAEKGEIKPGFRKADVLKLVEAEDYIKKAKELLDIISIGS